MDVWLPGSDVLFMTIDELNQLSAAEAEVNFLRCCGSKAWAEKMSGLRPYAHLANVHDAAITVWNSLPRVDWMEAFTAHPRIGDVSSLRKKFANTKAWASGEQSGMDAAAEEIILGLAEGNRRYEEKFGFIFIVCATGKTAEEMYKLLMARYPNDEQTEIQLAGAEQLKITHLRIDKWLQD